VELEQVRARLVADASGFQAGMQQAQGSLQGFTRTGADAGRGMHMVRGAMVALAAEATGTAGPLAHLSSGLLLFGGGSTVLIAIAAGVAAIGAAIHALGAESREAAKQTEQLLKTLTAIGPIGAARAEIMRITSALADAQARLAALQRPVTPDIGNISTALDIAFPQGRAADAERIKAQITGLQNDLVRAQGRLNAAIQTQQDALERILHQRNEEARRLDFIGNKSENIALDWQAAEESIRHSVDALNVLKEKDIEKLMSTESLGGTKFAKGLKGQVEDATKPLRELGVSAGRQLIMGIMDGMMSMQEILKRVFLTLIDFAIGQFLGGIFHTGVMGGGHAISGEGAARLVGPATMQMNMNMSGLQPLTVFALSRDPAWQQAFRETQLVATQQGFRG